MLHFKIYLFITHRKISRKDKINNFKITAPTWIDEFEDYIEHIKEKHETLLINPPIYPYSNRINNRLVFKITYMDLSWNHKLLKEWNY